MFGSWGIWYVKKACDGCSVTPMRLSRLDRKAFLRLPRCPPDRWGYSSWEERCLLTSWWTEPGGDRCSSRALSWSRSSSSSWVRFSEEAQTNVHSPLCCDCWRVSREIVTSRRHFFACFREAVKASLARRFPSFLFSVSTSHLYLSFSACRGGSICRLNCTIHVSCAHCAPMCA